MPYMNRIRRPNVAPPPHERNVLIRMYFNQGYTAREIQGFLLLEHGYAVSIRQLYRILSSLGLRRHPYSSDLEDIVGAIHNELQSPARDLGYRFMRLRLAEQNIFASCETVRLCLSLLDEDGVAGRRVHRWRRRIYSNHGPNYAIHMDGWDKIKPYGVCIHRAIDGFSKRVLWLKACRSNKKPEFVANFYLHYIEEINGVPRLLCADAGTENCLVRDIQRSLRANHNDDMSGMSSYRSIPSTQNIRIERFWRFLKNSHGMFWINLFKDMVDSGVLNLLDPIHIECVRFVFMPLIQRDLDRLQQEWNAHRVQRNRNGDTPVGKPDVLYYQADLFEAMDYKCNLSYDIGTVRNITGAKPPPELGCCDEFAEVALTVMLQNHYRFPNSYAECLILFSRLLQNLQQYAN